MRAFLDHLIFGVSSLDGGARWLEERLGAPLAEGGEHETMGTHNRLLRLGERSYLELIAINPLSKRPDRPRWFGLDAPSMSARLQTPRLLTWVASTKGISSVALSASYDPGKPHAMSRGTLAWQITIREDGSLAEGGALPSLIEWPEGVHPAASLPEQGVTLTALELCVPDPSRMAGALGSIGLDIPANRVRVIPDPAGPRLRAWLGTPRGAARFASFSFSQ